MTISESDPAMLPERDLVESDAPSYSHRQIMTIFAGLMAGMFVAAIDQTVVSTAMPRIVSQLHGIDRYTWVTTAYLVTETAVMPLVGRLSDLWGSKRLFQASIVIFSCASLLCGAAQTLNQLIVFRSIQGIGAGGLMVLAFAIAGQVVAPRDRGRYQGLVGSVFAVASVIGPLIGGAIVDHASWRWVFYVNVPVGLIAIAITAKALKLPRRRSTVAIDVVGVGLLVAAVACLIFVTELGNSHGWTSTFTLMLGGGGLVFLAAFIAWERRVEAPILPLRLFRNPVVSLTGAFAFCVGMTMFGTIVFLPVYLQIVQGRSATNAGLLLIPFMGGVLVASITSGRLISRIGRYKPFPIVGMALASTACYLYSTMDHATPYSRAGLYMVTMGLGIGMVTPVLILAIQNAVSPEDIGVATSTSTFLRSMGGAFATAIFGSILTSRLNANAPKYFGKGMTADKLNRLMLSGAGSGTHRPVPIALRLTFEHSLQSVFRSVIPVTFVALLCSVLVPDRRLRTSNVVGSTDL